MKKIIQDMVHFVKKCASKLKRKNKKVPKHTQEAMETLINSMSIEELENILSSRHQD